LLEETYLMESNDEISRLEIKTDIQSVAKQASWAGLKTGMKVADIGCGSGKTTSILHNLVQPAGIAVGIDKSEKRIKHARDRYVAKGIEFICRDILCTIDEVGGFDFAWVRFFLEYHRKNAFEIVKNISNMLRPGGILCLIDLDYNCLSHFGLSERLEKSIFSAMKILEIDADFDPYMGRRLYSFLYDLGYEEISVDISAHHLIYGELKHTDEFNWLKKVEVISKKINYDFAEYERGFEGFAEEFNRFFSDPRRFTYSPLIACRGQKPII
jgi:ubiquinone/menaquinone biosynthesis C-methylase UbiE